MNTTFFIALFALLSTMTFAQTCRLQVGVHNYTYNPCNPYCASSTPNNS